MPATDQQRRFTHPVGYGRSVAESDDARMGREARHGDAVARQLVRDANRNPVSGPRELKRIVTPDGELHPIIDAQFLAEAEARVRIHMARGFWDQAIETIRALEGEWELRKASSGIKAVKREDCLAWHVSNIFDPRTANLIEMLCAGTVGSLLECFPKAFIKYNGCGPVTVSRIAKTLVKIGVLGEAEALEKLNEYRAAIGCKPNNAALTS